MYCSDNSVLVVGILSLPFARQLRLEVYNTLSLDSRMTLKTHSVRIQATQKQKAYDDGAAYEWRLEVLLLLHFV